MFACDERKVKLQIMKWKYKVVNINVYFNTGDGCKEKIQSVCDEMAKEGWELINFQCYDASSKFLLIFKRELNA